MFYTKEANYLILLYENANLNSQNGEILEIPHFCHNNCIITVTFIPTEEINIVGIMAVKIRTQTNVVFTPFYLKNHFDKDDKTNEIEFIPYFDKAEYNAIKEEIITVDNNSTIPLFEDISKHILECDKDKVVTQKATIWEDYQKERTVNPSPENNNMMPMTIKNVRIGAASKKRIYRMFPYDDAKNIVSALWEARKTIVFTSTPTKARNIYALLESYHISIEQ